MHTGNIPSVDKAKRFFLMNAAFWRETTSWSGIGRHIGLPIVAGPVAQWITRLTTDQKIPGSNPGRFGNFSRNLCHTIQYADVTT